MRVVQSRPQALLSFAILVSQAIAVICQFIQHTDRTFPLAYFTVDSAVFAAIVAVVALVSPQCAKLPSLRSASAVAVLLSALIFATLIAPASNSGTWIQPYDDYWVRTATILFHFVGPVLVAVDFVVHDVGDVRILRSLSEAYIWPLAYLTGLYSLSILFAIQVPYPFLDPGQLGWWTVFGSVGALALLISVLALAQLTANRWWHRWLKLIKR